MMDAAIAWPSGNCYLFDGPTYSRWNPSGVCDTTGSSVRENWRGLWPEGVGAAVYWGYGKAYFFRGPDYARYDAESDAVEYVKPIAEGWPGLWQTGIDAAVNWLNGKIYMFRGPEYARWDIPHDNLDQGYPRPIAGYWPGLWPEGFDAVLYPGGRFAYFFKGDRVRTYDIRSDKTVGETAISALALESLPPGMVAPARELSREQAAKIAAYLSNQGMFSFKDAWTQLTRGPDGSVISLAPGRNVTIEPARVGTVDLILAGNPAARTCSNLDPRMLVALERLSRWLNADRADVSAIFHMGIGQGRGPANDCHNQGRALDFAGVAGTVDGTEFTRRVLDDWGTRPETASGFRLSSADDPIAYDLFRRTCAFGTYECECRRGNKWPPTQIGDAGFVIYPDYPSNTSENAKLRRDHRDHIHMQVGPTFS